MMNARDARIPKSNRKRKDENTSGPPPQRKSQRLAAKGQPPMKILNVIDDCLEEIFGHLDLRELFNVAVANEYLRSAAGVAYKRKFGKKGVCLRFNHPSSESHLEPYNCYERIYVDGLKPCLQFLRCLGPSIGKLNIEYDGWNEKQCDYMHQYVSEYCVHSLVTIEMWNKPIGIQMKHFDKPFVNVHTVKINRSDWGKQFSSFLKLFPNMRVLVLDRVFVHTFQAIDSPFQHLVDLSINLVNSGHILTDLLQLCPQLQSLDIRMNEGNRMTLDALLNIIKDNRNICKLKVNKACMTTRITLSDVQQIIDKHPSLIELELFGSGITVDAVFAVIRQLTALKKFRFQIVSPVEFNRIKSQLDAQWQLIHYVQYGLLMHYHVHYGFYVTLQR